MSMTIKQVKKTKVYDVFCGTGWADHTRVMVKDGHVFYREGRKLSTIQYVEVAKSITKGK